MRMAWGVVWAIGTGICSAASAQSVEDKLCIFEAARKMPTIPGLAIMSSSTRALPIEDGLNKLAGVIGTIHTTGQLEREFGYLDYPIPSGFLEAKLAVLQGLKHKPPSSVKEVRLAIKAAGQSAVFSSVCAVGASGSVGAWGIGIVE